VWGVVDGNPAVVTTPGATAAAPCTAGGQTFANCNNSLDQRRELSLLNPAVGQYYGYLDWVTDAGWQDYQGLLLSVQRRAAGGFVATANYTLSRCEGLINQGQGPLNVATGYQKPVSLINPPSEAEAQKVFDEDKGNCDNWRKHIFNLTASTRRRTSAAPRHACSRRAGGSRESSVHSQAPLTIITGADVRCGIGCRRSAGRCWTIAARRTTG
jgi:hypothetical protein